KATTAEISGQNDNQILKRYTKKLYKDFSNDVLNNEELDKIQDELNDTLKTTDFDLDGNEINDFIDIENVINGIDGLADNISNVFGDKEGKGQVLAQLENSLITKQYLQAELAQSLTSELKSTGTNIERQEEISKILYGYEEITNVDGSISFDIGTKDSPKTNSLISDIEDLGDINTDINIDKTTVLRQVLAPEFINAPSSPEKTAAISKILYGFETDKLDKTKITIGSPGQLKNKSLLANIEELKIKATRILDKALPEDETDLINLMDEKKADYTGIEQQSIKRLILLMFVLSMLEYSDWEYQKTEADQSRYAVS
ncbi:MAG: hypothetical protein O3C63_07820, partial [Cyanobacteria bacterium]|nr:hypothetical protein [Cyanobacteriota bacterium]